MRRDTDYPFFRPLWRRLVLIAVVLAWSAFEWWNGETFWGVLTLAAAAYGAYVFLIDYDPPPVDGPPPPGR